MNGYPEWVSEGSSRKYDRAKVVLAKKNVDLKAAGQPEIEITEEAIKALYKDYGGLLVEEAENDVFEEVIVSEKIVPKKRGRK